MMWVFAIITSTVISWVIYSLRAEVRDARRFGQCVLERKLGEGGIFDYGRTEDDIFYYAMELLDGATLEQIVGVDSAQPPGRVVRILTMACGALAEAHDIGLIHRDIKPANIMLCTQGGEHDVVKVLDFGLVKELDVERDVKLTGQNAMTGTPQYMAPESILQPDSVDARTDGKSVVEVCSQHLHQPPMPLSLRGITIPAELEAIVLACLDKDPNRRPQSAAELRHSIEACHIEPWDGNQARAWWSERKAALNSAGAKGTGEARTIAVNVAHRLSTELSGE